MHLLITPPLVIKTSTGRKIELIPVHMRIPSPSSDKELWSKFLKTAGQRILCDDKTIEKVQSYMALHRTEALSEDGATAFTVAANALQECLPEVCGDPFDADEWEEMGS